MCGTKRKNRHDKSLEEDKFHVELVVLGKSKNRRSRLEYDEGLL